MEDLTYGYRRPCVMDIKMGRKTYGDDANSFKKHYMISKDKSTTSYKHGLRIVASKVWSEKLKAYVVFSRGFCNYISTEEQLEKHLLCFFCSGLSGQVFQHPSFSATITSTLASTLVPPQLYTVSNEGPPENIYVGDVADTSPHIPSLDFPLSTKEIRLDVLSFVIERLEVLHKWMSKQNVWRMYSSSLLFVYEGDKSVQSPHVKADLRMIDFAHVFEIKEKAGKDTGYGMGLTKLIQTLKNFHSRVSALIQGQSDTKDVDVDH